MVIYAAKDRGAVVQNDGHTRTVENNRLGGQLLLTPWGTVTVSVMPERSGKPKTPKAKRPPTDPNKAAKRVLDAVIAATEAEPKKNAAAVALGRMGGLKGGKARAASLSPAQRKASAKRAAKARWGT